MSDEKKEVKRKPLGLKLDQGPRKAGSTESIRQHLSHGRSKTVIVEVKRGSRLASHPDSHSGDARFTDQEQDRRFRAVQQSLHEDLRKQKLQEEEQRLEQERLVEQVRLEEERRLSEAKDLLAQQEKKASLLVEKEKEPLSSVSTPSKTGERADFRDKTGKKEVEIKKTRSGVRADPEKDVAKKPFLKRGRDAENRDDTVKEGLEEEVVEHKVFRPIVGLKKLRSKRKMASRDMRGPFVVRCLEVKDEMSAHEIGEALGLKVSDILKALLKMGESATIHSRLDADTAELIAREFGHEAIRIHTENLEDALWGRPKNFTCARPPVVTIMGHVDHGKTSLLDAIRKTSVAVHEQGGITQHIGAYQVHLASGARITFIDTPGHEAFTQMRARGAHATDIVILVVAADDGVKTQTIEAIRHAQAAEVPIIVAINKIDKPGARPDQVRSELLSYGVVVESLGGDVLEVEVSALTKKNLDLLEQVILLQAEIMDLKTDPETPAQGLVIETHVKKGYGTVATILVQNGTLRKGDLFVVGNVSGRVRLMFDDLGKTVSKATGGQPVELSGFSGVPHSGDRFMVVESEAEIKRFLHWRESFQAQHETSTDIPRTHDIGEMLRAQSMKDLKLIVKADVQGSLEGMQHELNKLLHDEVRLKVIHEALGSVTESDALLAHASDASILAFNVSTLPGAQKLVETHKIPLLKHRIIYQALDEVRAALSGLLDPDLQEVFLGQAEIIQLFPVKRGPTVAGCSVKKGLMRRGEMVRIIRNKKEIFKGPIKTLQHLKDDRKEIKEGFECGMTFTLFNDFQIGDKVECYEVKTVLRTIEFKASGDTSDEKKSGRPS